MYKNMNEYDFVFTSRYMKGGESEDDTLVTWIGNQIFSLLTKLLFFNSFRCTLHFLNG